MFFSPLDPLCSCITILDDFLQILSTVSSWDSWAETETYSLLRTMKTKLHTWKGLSSQLDTSFFLCCLNWHKKTKKNISGQARLERLERPDLCNNRKSFLRQSFLFLVLVTCYQKGIRSRTTVVIKWYCSFVFKGKSSREHSFLDCLLSLETSENRTLFPYNLSFIQHHLELHSFNCSKKRKISWFLAENPIWNQYLGIYLLLSCSQWMIWNKFYFLNNLKQISEKTLVCIIFKYQLTWPALFC